MLNRVLIPVFLSGFSLALACGDDAGGGSSACEPNASVACTCADGSTAAQQCNADGTAYGVCACAAGPAATATAQPSTSATTAPPAVDLSKPECQTCLPTNCPPEWTACQDDVGCKCAVDAGCGMDVSDLAGTLGCFNNAGCDSSALLNAATVGQSLTSCGTSSCQPECTVQ